MCAKKVAAPKKKGSCPLKKAPPKKAKSPARPTNRRAESNSASAGTSDSPPPTVVSSAVVAETGQGGVSTQRVFNCKESPVIPGELVAGVHDIGPAARMMRAGPLPDSLDLRADWWNVGDQGGTGACVGWAVGDGLMRYYWTKKDKLSPGERLSVRYVWMGAKETDEFGERPTTFLETAGTSIRSALQLFKEDGCVKESLLPLSGGLSMLSEDAFFLQAQDYKIRTDFTPVLLEAEAWKRWLFKEGPIVARLLVDHTFMNASATNPLLDTYVPVANPETMGHAVTIVGYTAHDEFIIRNSWGTTKWGDAGFALATFDYIQAAFTESFGVYFTL